MNTLTDEEYYTVTGATGGEVPATFLTFNLLVKIDTLLKGSDHSRGATL